VTDRWIPIRAYGRGRSANSATGAQSRPTDVDVTEPTMSSLFSLYLRHLKNRGRAKNTLRGYRSAFKRAEIELGAIPVRALDLADLVILHEGWHETPSLADRTIGYISASLTQAERMGWRPIGTNPCRLVERYNPRPRTIPPLTADTLRRVLDAIDWLASAESIDATCAGIFRLLVFTGARLSEIRDCRWEWVDWDGCVLDLPQAKTGPRKIALCEEALHVLRRLGSQAWSDWCFPGRFGDGPRVEVRRAWARVVERVGVEGLWRHHLRHGFATVMVEGGMPVPLVAELLGHKDTRTTDRYAHPRVARLRGDVSRILGAA